MSNSPIASPRINGTEGISTKLKKSLDSLMTSSKSLQNAIIKRKPGAIWEILADQEKMITDLEQYGFLWGQLYSKDDNNDETLQAFKTMIRNNIQEVQRISNANGHLSRSYLSAIRKAMKDAGTSLAGSKKNKIDTYGRHGRMNIKKSLIINKTG